LAKSAQYWRDEFETRYNWIAPCVYAPTRALLTEAVEALRGASKGLMAYQHTCDSYGLHSFCTACRGNRIKRDIDALLARIDAKDSPAPPTSDAQSSRLFADSTDEWAARSPRRPRSSKTSKESRRSS
jgi:hypothetical protein